MVFLSNDIVKSKLQHSIEVDINIRIRLDRKEKKEPIKSTSPSIKCNGRPKEFITIVILLLAT